jgi:hypothetical protein
VQPLHLEDDGRGDAGAQAAFPIHRHDLDGWEKRQRQQNEPLEDVYPNKRAPVVVVEKGEHVEEGGLAQHLLTS